MTGLENKAVKLLNEVCTTDNLYSYHSSHDSFLGAGSYRKVFGFKYCGRKYVVKMDRYQRSHFGDEKIMGYGNEGEYLYWEKHKGTRRGSVLAPVLAFGNYGNYDEYTYLIMPKLQTIDSIGGDKYKILKERILPTLKNANLRVKISPYRWIECVEFKDLNVGNFGMNNRGRWFIIDYQGDARV